MADPILRQQGDYKYWDFGNGKVADYGSYKPLGFHEDSPGPGQGRLSVGSENDKNLDDYLSRVKGRMDSPDQWSGRAIDQATSKIRDATEGRRKALRSMMAKRGVMGDTSVPELSEASLSAQEGRDVAGAAADISTQRERDKDAFLLGSQGAFAAPGQANLQNRQMGLNTWQAAENARLSRESMEMQQWMQNLDSTLKLLDL